MKTFGPPGYGSPAEEPGIPSKTLQWRGGASNAKAAGLDRSFRRPKLDGWLGRDGPQQDRTPGESQWIAGSLGPRACLHHILTEERYPAWPLGRRPRPNPYPPRLLS